VVDRRLEAGLLLLLVVALAAGCPKRTARNADDTAPDSGAQIVHEDAFIEIALPSGLPLTVRAEWTWDEEAGPAPVVLLPPGGGNVSRRGTRASDGARSYDKPVDVTRGVAEMLAAHGFAALAWDKRTCGPRDTPLCGRYSTSDLDEEGPRALVKDLDAACRLALDDERGDGRVILWAHGQATQVALVSECAKQAEVMVLVAPVPRRVDKVMVASLWARAQAARQAANKAGTEEAQERALELKNRTASFDAMFKAIENDQFLGGGAGSSSPEDARVLGATLSFWKAWIALTNEVPGDAPQPIQPWIVVLGQKDTQYGPTDRKRIKALGEVPKARLVEIPGVDHHLLAGGQLDQTRLMPIVDALHEALQAGPSS
jgi:pimeloyl-ACP methyl ester carboxylesterase